MICRPDNLDNREDHRLEDRALAGLPMGRWRFRRRFVDREVGLGGLQVEGTSQSSPGGGGGG